MLCGEGVVLLKQKVVLRGADRTIKIYVRVEHYHIDLMLSSQY